VVSAIEAARGSDSLERTRAFAELVEKAVGGRRPTDRIHPATRTFQGVRIAVNRELAVIEAALPGAFGKLSAGGRLAAISFHSLEDRIIKRFSAAWRVVRSMAATPHRDSSGSAGRRL
jgi:16S rRNA (cytosine1402-N4)-methyltransferase